MKTAVLFQNITDYSERVTKMEKFGEPVWLVTGSATGFGSEIAQCALANGHRVAVTARDPARLKKLCDQYPETALPLELDVTRADHIAVALEKIEQTFGRVDVLVNNAGYGFVAAVEEASEHEIRRLMETHFFGSVALIKAVLPGMRQRQYGHIINFSSVAGIIGSAGTAFYAAAKFAIEGLSEGLSKEVADLGIKVSIIEPGPFQTNFFTTSRCMGETVIDDYASTAGAYRERASKPEPWLPGDPARAAQVIFDIALSPSPPLRLLLGRPALEMATVKLKSHLAEIEQWQELTLSADKPDASGRSWP